MAVSSMSVNHRLSSPAPITVVITKIMTVMDKPMKALWVAFSTVVPGSVRGAAFDPVSTDKKEVEVARPIRISLHSMAIAIASTKTVMEDLMNIMEQSR